MSQPQQTIPASRLTEGSVAKISAQPSVAHVRDAWYIVCTTDELRGKPLARQLYGDPLVVFRGSGGRPGVLLDRCAHRNVPLSRGELSDGRLECPYHGWQYDAAGDCKRIPAFCGSAELPRRAVPSFAAREQDGYVWAYARPNTEPTSEPFRIADLGRGYTHVRRIVEAQSTLHAAVENALDVPHTAFLHKGLFRGTGTSNRIQAVVTRDANSVTTEYIGEPRPEGLAGRILSPSGGLVSHYDRFIMPSIAQVEYAIGDENHILVNSICTPVDDYHTRMYAIVSFRMRVPAALVKAILNPIAMKIFGQDAIMLKVQTDAIQRFGGEYYTSTEIDLMGPQIWRLLKRAAEGKGSKDNDANWRREVTLEV